MTDVLPDTGTVAIVSPSMQLDIDPEDSMALEDEESIKLLDTLDEGEVWEGEDELG